VKSLVPRLIKVAGWIAGVTAGLLLLDYTLFRGLEVGAVAVPLPRRSPSRGSTRVGVIPIPRGTLAISTI
jgi:hypothetical protein